MVACTTYIPTAFNWVDCHFFKLGYRSFRLFVVLMKQIFSYISSLMRMIAKGISYTLTTILLIVVFIVLVIPYSCFLKPNKQSWISRNISFTPNSFNKPW